MHTATQPRYRVAPDHEANYPGLWADWARMRDEAADRFRTYARIRLGLPYRMTPEQQQILDTDAVYLASLDNWRRAYPEPIRDSA